MKRFTIAATLILVCVIAYAAAAHAQQVSAGKADPAKVDSKHYKVVFENDSVRVLRITIAPGEKSVMHHHPNSVIVNLVDDKTLMTTPDGKSHEVLGKAGQVSWAPAGYHLPQNVGDTRDEVIVVELKK